MTKQLPVGIQTFEKIIKRNCLYVDKTKEAFDLIKNYEYVFLSRPRRFGKSLFVDTLKCIFEGRKELFEGLYIYDKWDWDDTYPVIKISWSGILTKPDLVISRGKTILKQNQKRLGIECESENISDIFDEMIIKTYGKYNKKVVILIDEYDKPILDNILKEKIADEIRDILRGLYSVMKDKDEYIRFVFLTGVSKFSKTSIFSGLNMLEDISLNPNFGNICGYTQKDLETLFAEYLVNVDMEKVKKWYNGYYWLKDRVYNPFDILQFIRNQFDFKSYWFETGTPSFLVKLIKTNNYYLPQLTELVVDNNMLDSFDIENIALETLLFQTGYLTIDRRELLDEQYIYYLKIPNLEVSYAFTDKILEIYQNNLAKKKKIQIEAKSALLKEDLEKFYNLLKDLFSSIPYSNFRKNKIEKYEGFYASVAFTYFYSLGFEVIAEDVTNIGSIDLTIKVQNKIYIFEFKVNKESALEQIKEKKYYEKYLEKAEKIFIVGISFDSKKRNVREFKYERIK